MANRPNTIRLDELLTRWDYEDQAYADDIAEEFDRSDQTDLCLPAWLDQSR